MSRVCKEKGSEKMTIEEKLSIVLDVFIKYPQKYEELKQELMTIGSERQDLLHALELGRLNAIQRTKLVNELKEVQSKRRKIKDELEILDEIKRFTSTVRLKERQINEIIERIKSIKERHKTRTYTMRVRTDLQDVVDNAQT